MTFTPKQIERRIIIGTELNQNGIHRKIVVPISSFRKYMKVPVSWHGQIGTMYFQNLNRKAGFNRIATDLFDRDGFSINGRAVVETHRGTWQGLRVIGSEAGVRAKFAHLSLGRHEVLPAFRNSMFLDVIAEEPNDVIMLKMVL
jgi:hypothetical protein